MIPHLQVQGLTFRVGDRTLFENISFSIAQGQRVGLIAQNGTGKTTLLNLIAGKEQPESGSLVFHSGLRVSYLEQTPHFPPGLNVIEACFWFGNETTNLIREYESCMETPGHPGLQEILNRMDQLNAWDYETRSKSILSKLDITEYHKPLNQLSGGQLKRVALANALITEPDFLILDEPTNHLDLQMIEWLEGYLNHGNTTILMVTHDRYFLDRVCSKIIELDEQTVFEYRGNYAYYLQKRQERLDVARSEVAKAHNLYRTELDWMRRMPQARGHKARYRQEAFYELEKQAKRRIEENKVRLEMKSTYIGSKIFESEYVSKSYGEKRILKDFYYNFSRYEKMGIVGANGTGKSTFVKMLMGLVKPDSGRFVIGETVRFGYFNQDGMDFDEQMKVIDAVRRIAEYVDLGGGRHLSAMQFLQHFMFTPKQQQNYIYKLSGGEKRRLYLCTVLMTNPNFLVLDEPTNDLDILTLQILEQYLQDFHGCVIVVSHDRYFMDKVVDHLLVFNGNAEIKDFPGNYTQYRQWIELDDAPKNTTGTSSVAPNNKTSKSSTYISVHARKMTYREKCEFEQLEVDIDRLEKEKADIEQALSGAVLSVEQITQMSKRLPELNKELDEKSERWLELSELK